MSESTLLTPQLFLRTEFPDHAVRALGDHPTGFQAFGHLKVYFVYQDTSEKTGFSFFRDYDAGRTAGSYGYRGLVFKCQIDENHEHPYAVGLYLEDEVQLTEAERLVRTMKMIDRRTERNARRWGQPLTFGTQAQYIANAISAKTIYYRAIDEERTRGYTENATFYARDIVDCATVVNQAAERVRMACRKMCGMQEVNP